MTPEMELAARAFALLRENWGLVVTAVNAALVVYLIPRIILERRDSPATLAWVLGILLVPVGGAILYALIGVRR
ncbi:MAG: PLDc N-terminal domain-containing protein, partial [Candidatus Methylomirabilis sp.]|nr:PLDc N-terminal domain-containing protein [Deltaproteobacteria bacterium]